MFALGIMQVGADCTYFPNLRQRVTLSDSSSEFGYSVASLGDVDGDLIVDMVIGAPDSGDTSYGDIWIIFFDNDGGHSSDQRISSSAGDFTGTLEISDWFGNSVAGLGDLNADSFVDVAVSAKNQNENYGAIYIIFLSNVGKCLSHQKISESQGSLTAYITGATTWFGRSLSALGDIDGDSTVDIVVGATAVDDGGTSYGALFVIFLNPTGLCRSHQRISALQGDFTAVLDQTAYFGLSSTELGDLNKDSFLDVAVGSAHLDDGGTNRGAVYVIFLGQTALTLSHQKISDSSGDFTGDLDDNDYFGRSVGYVSDLNYDDVQELLVGANGDDNGNTNAGAVYLIFLTTSGTCLSNLKMSDTKGGFTGSLDDDDYFGSSVAMIGDLDGDGRSELAIGAYGKDRVYILSDDSGIIPLYKYHHSFTVVFVVTLFFK